MSDDYRGKGFYAWGVWMYRLRWAMVILWGVLLLCSATFAADATKLLKDNGFTPHGSESERGMSMLGDTLGIPETTISIVYQSEGTDLTTPEWQSKLMASLEQVTELPYAEQPYFVEASRNDNDRTVQTINIPLTLNTDEALEEYSRLKTMLEAPDGVSMFITGGPAMLHDMQIASQSDIVKAEMIGLPIALVVLLIIFGTVIAALLPLIVGIASVSMTLGIVYFIAQDVSLSNFLPNIVTMLGLAVGIDYALFIVSRFREELAKQPSLEKAVAMTSATAGRSIFFSGVAVMIGLIGMLMIDLNIFRSLALGGILVVTLSVLVANTLLMSVLALIGRHVNRWRVIPSRLARDGQQKAWTRIAYGVMKRPMVLSVALFILFAVMMLPLGWIKLGVPDAEVLPPTYESRAGNDLMMQTYRTNELSPVHVLAETEASVWDPGTVVHIRQAIERIESLAEVESVMSYLSFLPAASNEEAAFLLQQEAVRTQIERQKLAKDQYALLTVIPAHDPESEEAERLVERLRAMEADGLELIVTGSTAYRMDIISQIHDGLPYSVGFVLLVTFLVLMFAFRSIVIPLKAVIMNVLSLGASLGAVVCVFQFGFMADALQITSTGYVSAILPVIIFCVVFGISMDYEVFLISRIMEEYEASGDNERSTAEGLKRTGGLITSAAFILIVVVGTFIFTDIEIMKALGLGLVLAVLLDASIIRIVLVPALMKLMGKANWWWPLKSKSKGAVQR